VPALFPSITATGMHARIQGVRMGPVTQLTDLKHLAANS